MPTPAETILSKAVLPTWLDTAGIRAKWPAEIRRRAFFSARTASAAYLDRLRSLCAEVAAGEIDNATARKALIGFLDAAGYAPGPDDTGLRNLASRRRLDLILDTQRQMAHGAALAVSQGSGPALSAFPAWRLERYGSRRAPRRDWLARWKAAGDACGWEGALRDRFVALKGSPIWRGLGDGAGGFRDTLGNPYPPFAFGSGMDWTPVRREECRDLGLDPDGGRKPEAPSLSPGQEDVRKAAAGLSPEMREALVAQLRATVANSAALANSEDARGNEHAPKGSPDGGRFVSKGGGGESGAGKPARNDGRIVFPNQRARAKADDQARGDGYAGIDDLMAKSGEVPKERIDAILKGGGPCEPHEAAAVLRSGATITPGAKGEKPVKLTESALRHYVCGERRREPDIDRLRMLPAAIAAIMNPDEVRHELDNSLEFADENGKYPKRTQTVYAKNEGRKSTMKVYAYTDSGVLSGWHVKR